MTSHGPRRMTFLALVSLVLGCLVVGVPGAARASAEWLVNPANGHAYALTDESLSSFTEHEAQAVSWGGHLVTIDDQDEQDWLYEQFDSRSYLIGLNDIDVEGSFVWVSGQSATYTNWCDGEPNDGGLDGEDAVSMWKVDGMPCWNDITSTGPGIGPGIVEIDSLPPSWIRASASSNPDRVEGYNFAPDTEVTLTVNTVAVTDPLTTDGNGNFGYNPNTDFDLDVGDVVEVTVGAQTRSLTLVGLTFDVLDYEADTASGTSDQPDGTTVNVNAGNESGGENIETTVTSGTWAVAFTIDVTYDMGGQAAISDTDGDQTFVDSPQPPQIRASASSNPDRVEGYNFAPDTEVTLTVNTVAVTDPLTTDGNGNFGYNPNTDFDLDVGDVVEVTVGAQTRSLTLVGLTFDVLDYDADTASGTSDQPDGTTVNVGVGNMSGGENIETTITSGAWAATFTIDVTYDMGGDASISEPDNDQTFANFLTTPPTLDLNPATDLTDGQSITLTGAGWPAGATLYVTECRLDMGLSFDTCDGSTQQAYTLEPDGTLPVDPASEFTVAQNISTTSGDVDCGAAPNSCGLVGTVWAGDVGVGYPIALDFPSNNVINFAVGPIFQLILTTSTGGAGVGTGMIGNGWAPDTEVAIDVDATAQSPDATVTTDGTGSFNLAQGLLFVSAGDLVTVTDGASTKTLIVPPLAVTDIDVDTDTISGTAADGTVEVTVGGDFRTTAEVTSGEWAADLTPYDLVTTDAGFVFQYDEDGDGTVIWWSANPAFTLGLIPGSSANMYGNGWAPDTEVTIEVDATVLSPDATVTTDGAGAFGVPEGLIVEAGDLVTVSDGTSTKTLIVPPLAVTDIDVNADTITGTAADGVASVRIGGSFPWSAEAIVDVTGGTWVADFSPSSASPYDLVPGTFGFVGQMDEDNDAAQIPFWVNAPTAWPDFDGDGLADRSVFRPEFGGWYIDGQVTRYLGLSGDVPVPADYDGDGWTDPAVFRDGAWYIDGQTTKFLGAAGDVPVPGDYNGDGATEIAVYRNGAWYIDGQATRYLGMTGDVPVPGDYNGDGATEIAVFRPSVGGWYVDGVAPAFYGLSNDVPVPGDYNGDGATDRAVFRPEYGGWYVDGEVAQFIGLSSDVPVPGDYDGDGVTERAVFRPEFGGWYVQDAETVFYGLGTDIPLPLPAAVYNRYFML